MANNIYIEYHQSYSVTNEGASVSCSLSNAMSSFKGNSVLISNRIKGKEIRKFIYLKNKWRKETMFLSSSTQIYRNSAYRDIIDMGKKSIPWIIKDLKKTNSHWFNALYLITGEDPINPEHAGIVSKMAEDWIVWAENKGYVY